MRWTILGLLILTVTETPSQELEIHRVEITREPIPDDIQGFVYDQAGHPVGGAAVMVKSMRSGVEYRVNAGDDGWYTVGKLATTDSYEVSVTLPQFDTFDAKGVNVGWKLATHLDIVLRQK